MSSVTDYTNKERKVERTDEALEVDLIEFANYIKSNGIKVSIPDAELRVKYLNNKGAEKIVIGDANVVINTLKLAGYIVEIR